PHPVPRRKARHPLRHVLRWGAGWLFLVLGFLGFFLPVLQGVLFSAVGIWLLAPYVPLFRRMRRHFFHRFPGLRRRVRAFRKRFRGKAGKS
ncbi:MAG: hypothetical protein KDL10_02645, partial [Kiritimatiellae bacterium]|nr:hypothetical protein [Kiritimatiellia bacterium]